MMKWDRVRRSASVCLSLLLSLASSSASAQQAPDSSFKATIDKPAYTDRHPKVLFDEAHFNVHTTQGTYKTFVDLITSDGYQVTANQKPFGAKTLEGYDILVISNARGAPRPSEKPAFTDAECDAVRDWVRGGGSLLLVTDHYPTGHAAENLSKRFGVDMSKGVTTDRAHMPPDAQGGILIFSREDKLLGDHPILQGRDESERINRVATFSGQSLKGPEGSVALLKFSDTAVDRTLSGAGDGQSPIGPGRPKGARSPAAAQAMPQVSAAGRAQGVALKFGEGRIVVLGEASEISAQRAGPGQRPMGMNYPGCDNRQWTLNIMHWLSGLLEPSGKAARPHAPEQKPSQPDTDASTSAPRSTPQPVIELKLRVHYLKSDVAEVNAEPDEAAIQKMMEGVNAIFAPAAIHFTLEGVTHDAARDEPAQRELAEMSKKRGRDVVGDFARVVMRVVPDIPIEKAVMHIVIVHRFPLGMGGRYFPEAGYLVTPQVVPRGPQMPASDEDVGGEHPLEPKVMAHELGHGLKLLHVNIRENLMTVGMGPQDPKTWIQLTDWQIEKARKAAAEGKTLLRGDPLNPHAEEKAAAKAGPPGRTPRAPIGATKKPQPPAEPGNIDPKLWASREMQGGKWEVADLDARAVTSGVLQVAGRQDIQRWQVIYKATKFTGDFDVTVEYKGNCRIGLVCADGQRGFIGIQDTLPERGKLRIERTGKKVQFTLNGQPASPTKALATEEMPFYFGIILDNGMQCDLSSIHAH